MHPPSSFGSEALDRLAAELGWPAGTRRPEARVFGALLRAYGRPLDALPVVKVAGTNGKGSVSAMLGAALEADGKRVGVFTSPHLERVTERIRLGGRELSPGELDRLVRDLAPFVVRYAARHGPSRTPSFFQFLALAALHLLPDARADAAVFEAGVGGGTDSVSALPDRVSALTSVGLDHQEQLGGTLEEIARTKAGIARAGSVLVLAPGVPPGARRAVEEECARRGVRLVPARAGAVRVREAGPAGMTVEVELAGEVTEARLPLGGDFQAGNLACAVEVLSVLAAEGLVRSPRCVAGVSAVEWPGRFEYLPGPPEAVLDVAHNPEGMRALVASLRRYFPGRPPVVVYGAALDKPVEGAWAELAPAAGEVHLAGGFHRARGADDLARALPGGPPRCAHPSVEAAVRAAWARARDGRRPLVVTGSVFLVGAAREVLRELGYTLR